jgi:prepilin-type N-terminal cleavage/methylation domain-containing protein
MRRILRKVGKSARYGEKGFTLIELLIVVAILGILAAVIIPNVSTFLKTGTLNAARTELENVKTASMAYYAENSSWPGSSDNLSAFLTGTLKADYSFDTSNGLVTTGAPADNGAGAWSGIQWNTSTDTWDRTP